MSTNLMFPIAGAFHLTRGVIFARDRSAWTQYESKNGITIKVDLIMDEETRGAISLLARKSDEALALQMGEGK